MAFSFLFSQGAGLEPIAEQVSGGHLLKPVQTLVSTSIFATGENANRVLPPQPKKLPGICYGYRGFLAFLDCFCNWNVLLLRISLFDFPLCAYGFDKLLHPGSTIEELQQRKEKAEQTELRYKIRKTVRDLDNLQKEGQQAEICQGG